MTMHIEITRIHPDAVLPRYETDESAGFDLCSVTNVTVQPGKVALVPTGLVIHVPQRMFLGIFARSSTPVKRGLMVANGVGVIDPDYCGPTDEVKIAVMNFTDERRREGRRASRAGDFPAGAAGGVGRGGAAQPVPRRIRRDWPVSATSPSLLDLLHFG